MEQETFEEAAKEFAKNHSIYPTAQDDTEYGFKHGANWQAERMYSEEEVIELLNIFRIYSYHHGCGSSELLEWFEQFKKK